MSSTISVQLDAVDALADELGALAAELDEDVLECRSAAAQLAAALDGPVGWQAGATATAWSSLAAALVERATALSGGLRAAVGAYRALDSALVSELRPVRSGSVPPAR
ncbi:hypothetical protein OF117_20605 [Geodermatophilus sp. YIM 151500]|uniref:hypothetical protein n=1 Tax=Geodermatophilus sp. YIM 151500 TaxID=2984531 RepID=UPI0021E3985A|nr:hypothetical protein [Geodermatophilus sp. YIM 151500]MCV2491751.1 hypothetical protein [Geodermatophilus sp. YIM 151500]